MHILNLDTHARGCLCFACACMPCLRLQGSLACVLLQVGNTEAAGKMIRDVLRKAVALEGTCGLAIRHSFNNYQYLLNDKGMYSEVEALASEAQRLGINSTTEYFVRKERGEQGRYHMKTYVTP